MLVCVCVCGCARAHVCVCVCALTRVYVCVCVVKICYTSVVGRRAVVMSSCDLQLHHWHLCNPATPATHIQASPAAAVCLSVLSMSVCVCPCICLSKCVYLCVSASVCVCHSVCVCNVYLYNYVTSVSFCTVCERMSVFLTVYISASFVCLNRLCACL